LVKTLGKATIGDLISAVRRPFAKAAPEAVEAMGKKWAKESAEEVGEKAVKEVAEKAAKEADNITKMIETDLSKVSDLLSSEVKAEVSKAKEILRENIRSANKYLYRDISKFRTERKEVDKAIKGVKKYILNLENRSDFEARQSLQKYKDLEAQYVQEFGRLQEKENYLLDVFSMAGRPGKEKLAIEMLDKNPSVGHVGAQQWRNLLMSAHDEYQTKLQTFNSLIMGTTSKYLGNDAKFLEEYMALKKMPDGGKTVDRWVNNPKNKEKLFGLFMQNEKGDVPGWVLVTVMTAGLVAALWVVADTALAAMFSKAVESVSKP
jgi:cell division septum initiation protein DivIVA